jgi:ankyrin repeat protein
VCQLLDNGADIDALGGPVGRPALIIAIQRGHEGVVRLLLEKGCDLHAQSEMYGNALYWASFLGSAALVEILLEFGAEVNAHTIHGVGDARQIMREQGLEAVVHLLIRSAADADPRDHPLYSVAARGLEGVAQQVLYEVPDTDTHSDQFDTALQAASAQGHEAIVRLLLKNGADVNACGGQYGTALQAASDRDYESIVALLIQGGADASVLGDEYKPDLQRNEPAVKSPCGKGTADRTLAGEPESSSAPFKRASYGNSRVQVQRFSTS